MRTITPFQMGCFAALSLLALVLGITLDLLLLDALPLGDFRGVVLTVGGLCFFYLALMLIYRLFVAAFPLPVGEVAESPADEFRYHVHLLFFLMFFYPVMFSMLLPVPLLRLFYQCLGARLGRNTYTSGVLMDPPFIELGADTLVGRGALLVPHVIEGRRLAHLPIVVGDGVTIGAHAVVLAGCRIGDGATLAVGAVLGKGTVVGAGETWGGTPARRLTAARET